MQNSFELHCIFVTIYLPTCIYQQLKIENNGLVVTSHTGIPHVAVESPVQNLFSSIQGLKRVA